MHLVRAHSSGAAPRVQLPELFPGITSCESVVLRRPESRTIGWSLDLQELVHILTMVRHTRATKILEIGTFDGFTALNLAANVEGEVFTVDLPQGRSMLRDEVTNAEGGAFVGSKFRGEPEAGKIKQLWGDSMNTDWRDFGAPFDLILIDGSHAYPYVKCDSMNALKHIRPGGTIVWHDYGAIPDVSKAVDELARHHPIAAIAGTRLACLRSSPA
jgi:predicted O-methyltransferase YrrM